ncbi:hypothetical protein BKA59DRAFT_386348, partial [Fusarium tricinctum]
TYKRLLGKDYKETLESILLLILIYWNRGRWEEVIEIFKMKLKEDYLDTLRSINNLILIYWNKGRWEEAEKL